MGPMRYLQISMNLPEHQSVLVPKLALVERGI